MDVKITPKGIRVSQGKTQEEVADYLGISLTQYRRKENNKVRFYADEIYKLSKLYDVPVSIFFNNKVSFKDTRVEVD
ncbi:helix-turn-helix domain-containing protein [Bacillaceae bacterium W0354]